MKAILIDDEHLALTYLEYQLNMIGEVEIIGKYTNPLEGRQAVEQLDVDIVFWIFKSQKSMVWNWLKFYWSISLTCISSL